MILMLKNLVFHGELKSLIVMFNNKGVREQIWFNTTVYISLSKSFT